MAEPATQLNAHAPRAQSIVCAACGATDFVEVLPWREHKYQKDGKPAVLHFHVVQCRLCSLGMLVPRPDAESLAALYGQDYGCYQPRGDNGADARQTSKLALARWRFAPREERGRRLKRTLGRAIELLVGRTVSYSLALPLALPHDAAIFEIGYGGGAWLQTMHSRLGYRHLAGYDIAANTRHGEALAALGVSVSTGDFLTNDYGEGCWDCIRMEHVFEHLTQPVETAEKCRRMLKPEGVLVMTMPCARSFSGAISLEHSPNGRELPLHLFHHTQRSLDCILVRAGFETHLTRVYADATSFAVTLEGALGLPIDNTPARVATSAVRPVYSLVSRLLGQGELVTVVAGTRAALGQHGLM